jgi:hypothetical protein
MIAVSGATAAGQVETDAFDILVDEGGEVCVFVVKVESTAPLRSGLAAAALAVTRVALKSRLAIYELVADVRRFAGSEPGVRVGLSLLRFSPRDSRVEILNAGMPPIVRFLPGGAPSMYHGLSSAIGTRFGEVHPYELSPLVWGSCWALFSDGITGGSHSPADLSHRVAGSGLELRALELSMEPSAVLENLAASLAGGSEPFPDRTLLVVSADPGQRFESGIDARKKPDAK